MVPGCHFQSLRLFFFILPTLWWNATNAVMLVVPFFPTSLVFPAQTAIAHGPLITAACCVSFWPPPTERRSQGLWAVSANTCASAGVPDRFGDGRDAETTGNSCTSSHSRRRSPLWRGAAEGRLCRAAGLLLQLEINPWNFSRNLVGFKNQPHLLLGGSSRTFAVSLQGWTAVVVGKRFSHLNCLIWLMCCRWTWSCCFLCAAERPKSLAAVLKKRSLVRFTLSFFFGCGIRKPSADTLDIWAQTEFGR